MKILPILICSGLLALPLTGTANPDSCCCGVKKDKCAWCDSSGGRMVRNGDYSTCYCNRHAVMDMQKFMGCCEWHGGVKKITPVGVVVCDDSTISELCTRQHPVERIAAW